MKCWSMAAWAAMLWGAAVTAGAQTVWKLPTAYPQQNFQIENLARFAQEVEAASGGKLKLAIQANGSLLKAPQILPAVERGDVSIGELLMSEAAKDIPLMGLDSLPFLTEGYAGARSLWRLSRPATERALDKRGMIVLYAVGWPPQGIYSGKPIDGINDLKGLKFRAYNPATTRVAELMQAQPVNVPRPELTKALAQGDLGAIHEVLLRCQCLDSKERRCREQESIPCARSSFPAGTAQGRGGC